MKRWFAPENATVEEADVDFRVGGAYRIDIRASDGTLHVVTGVYQEITPPERLVFTWHWRTKAEDDRSLVRVEFLERGSETEVVLSHEGLQTELEREGHRHGWVGCLEKLATAI